MPTQQFPVFRSVLRAETLAERVLAQYDVGIPQSCYLHSRKINDIYFVRTIQGRWVLRVTAAHGHTPVQVQSEMDMLQHLAAAGIAVAAPVPRQDGAAVTTILAPEGERAAVLFPYIKHTPLNIANPEQAQRFGAAVAHMHRVADTYAAP